MLLGVCALKKLVIRLLDSLLNVFTKSLPHAFHFKHPLCVSTVVYNFLLILLKAFFPPEVFLLFVLCEYALHFCLHLIRTLFFFVKVNTNT